MDSNSDTPPARAATELRVRWGNVALALFALFAIAAAVWLPRGGAEASEPSAIPIAAEPTAPTAAAAAPAARSRTETGRRASRHTRRTVRAAPRRRRRKRAAGRGAAQQVPRRAAPVPLPSTETRPTRNQPEFGL
jgi:hypothetical protein